MARIWKGIIVHHSEGHDLPGLDTDAIRDWHVNGYGWKDIGYHFVVEYVGGGYEVVCGRFLSRDGAHARGYNHDHIGVCIVGDFSVHPPEPERLRFAAKFVRSLADVFGMRPEDIKRHCDVNDTTCPGAAFPWGEFTRLVWQWPAVPGWQDAGAGR